MAVRPLITYLRMKAPKINMLSTLLSYLVTQDRPSLNLTSLVGHDGRRILMKAFSVIQKNKTVAMKITSDIKWEMYHPKVAKRIIVDC